ncbi:hypothetical protein ACIA8O_39865 [Kitasatospora sp. NPDC051853]|uniref:hypothetical protein n=1 Tax=Kitasatospora sp. NPDC051853 TaxID=3364058 RepID=UPI0037B5237F
MRNQFVQLALFVAAIAGFVVLSIKGVDTLAYVGLVTPVLGAAFVVSRLDQRSDAQDQALSVITSQTNGVLTARIRTAVAEALAEHRADGSAPIVPQPLADGGGLNKAPF